MRRSSHGPLDLGPALADTLGQFRRTQQAWADSTLQDAIESIIRIPWLRQVRIGVGVPIHALYRVPATRAAQIAATRFVDAHIDVVSPALRVSAAALRLEANVNLDRDWTVPPQPGLRVRRGWNEREVPWRIRFESTLRTHLRQHGLAPLEDLLEHRLLDIVAAWQGVSRARIASREVSRYGSAPPLDTARP